MSASSPVRHVARIDASSLTGVDFLKYYAEKNEPVILTGIVEGWKAYKVWRSVSGGPNYTELASIFAGLEVPVVECRLSADEGYGEAIQTNMTAKDFIEYAQNFDQDPNQSDSSRLLYLKDWHMARDLPGWYDPPDYLARPLHDWLNMYKDWQSRGDDFKFCYFGVAGTYTPLHHDVMLSYSWSANIFGRKSWVLYPPDATQWLLDKRGETPSSVNPRRRPLGWQDRFPHLDKAWERRLEIVQEDAELLFVPSGWYHEVENLVTTASINHNWFNASNVMQIWGFLSAEHQAVHRHLDDLRDTFDSLQEWEEQCQRVMAANCGIDWLAWCDILTLAAEEMVRCLDSGGAAAEEAKRGLSSWRSAAASLRDALGQTALSLELPQVVKLADADERIAALDLH